MIRIYSPSPKISSLVLLLGAGVALASAPAHALVFEFQFDNAGNGLPLDPPIVGSGSFGFDGDPGVGSFALTSLGNYTFDFLFDDGNAFGNADITTPASEVLVLISQNENTYNLRFSNTNPFGGGHYDGALDFDNGSSTLTFEPPAFGGNLDMYIKTESNSSAPSGAYLASAPVPGPLPLMGAGAAFAWSRRLRRRIAKSTYKL
jgi:hypothetical protein